MKRVITFLATLLTLVSAPSFAKTKHAPLPEKILTAKTVYAENHGSAKLRDQVYEELRKWGRFSIVESRADADIVFLLSNESARAAHGSTSTYDPSANGGSGGWSYGSVHSVSRPEVHVEVLEAKTGEGLYADTQRSRSVGGLIKELRKRIEEQESTVKR